MNGDEYALTDEQQAAVDAMETAMPDASYELAHRYLVMNNPDLFDNTGDDIAKVRMNWYPTPVAEVPVEEKSSE